MLRCDVRTGCSLYSWSTEKCWRNVFYQWLKRGHLTWFVSIVDRVSWFRLVSITFNPIIMQEICGFFSINPNDLVQQHYCWSGRLNQYPMLDKILLNLLNQKLNFTTYSLWTNFFQFVELCQVIDKQLSKFNAFFANMSFYFRINTLDLLNISKWTDLWFQYVYSQTCQ